MQGVDPVTAHDVSRPNGLCYSRSWNVSWACMAVSSRALVSDEVTR